MQLNTPNGLALDDAIVYANKSPGELVGVFRPSDPDDLNANGESSFPPRKRLTDQDKVSISGMNLYHFESGSGHYLLNA